MASAADTSVDEADLVPLSALQHWLYCPRQCALIHVEQVWAENHATADGQARHVRVNERGEKVRRGVRTVTGMPLRSMRLGVSGAADGVELHRLAPINRGQVRARDFRMMENSATLLTDTARKTILVAWQGARSRRSSTPSWAKRRRWAFCRICRPGF